MDLKNLSSNWKKLQASGFISTGNGKPSTKKEKTSQTQSYGGVKRKRNVANSSNQAINGQIPAKRARLLPKSSVRRKRTMSQDEVGTEHVKTPEMGNGEAASMNNKSNERINEGLAADVEIGKYLALDCEMVGVGPNPDHESALARVSLVNYDGLQVYDSFVRPQEEVTDWRTHVSGIRPQHMIHARTFEDVQRQVAGLIKGRIVVGHAVRKDFEALFLDHPKRDIRDTARHAPYRKLAGGGSPKLKILVSELLGLEIQSGEHSSVEDARATMLLFKRDKPAFEREHIKKWGVPMPVKVQQKTDIGGAADEPRTDAPTKSKKKKKKKK